MKQITNKTKIIYLISLIIIIVGIIVIATKGFNFDLNYEATKQVELIIGKEFNISDIKQITNEIFGKQKVLIQKVEVYGDMISIKSSDITDEQKTSLVEKINEKYQTELKAEDIVLKTIPHTRARDIMKPYVTPFAIAMIIVLITLFVTIFAQLILIAIIAITRIPLGQITIPMMIFIYVISILGVTIKNEKELKKQKLEESK